MIKEKKFSFQIGQAVWYNHLKFYVVAKTKKIFDIVSLEGQLRTVSRTDRPWSNDYTFEKADGPKAKVITAQRVSDGYRHDAIVIDGKAAIHAGCHNFASTKLAATHWRTRRRGDERDYDKKEATYYWPDNRMVKRYNTREAIKHRQLDARLNKWSLAFVRRVEAARVRSARAMKKKAKR
jgi:hypothetical protein